MDTDGMMISSIKKIHSHEEILQALQVIKDVCDQHDNCTGCPFHVPNENGVYECKIRNDDELPAQWNIKDDDDEWKAFK